MEKKFLSKATISRCTELSWWNDGTERKPNKADFDNLQFKTLKNHNMKWVSLFNIELTIPREYEFNFFRLEYTYPSYNDHIVEYYYIEKVLDINSRNKKMLLTLDIWCTYILGGVPETIADDQINYLDAQTNRFLRKSDNTAKLSPLKKIDPLGYFTDEVAFEQIPYTFNIASRVKNGIWNNCDLSFNRNIVSKTLEPPSNKIKTLGVYKYYVFLGSNVNEGFDRVVNNATQEQMVQDRKDQQCIILIPVLFDWCGNYVAFPEGKFNNTKHFYSLPFSRQIISFRANESGWTFQKNPNFNEDVNITNKKITYHLFNDERNLIRLAERINEHKSWSGLSKFLGVHYGENYFNLTLDFDTQNDFFISRESEETKTTFKMLEPQGAGVHNIKYLLKADNFLCMEISHDYDGNIVGKNGDNLKGFAIARVPMSGLDVLDISKIDVNIDKTVSNFNAQNLYLLGDNTYPFSFGYRKVYFTDRFIVSNGFDIKEVDSEVPSVLDDFYNVLAATKPQRDTALRSAVGGFITSAVKDWLPPAIHGQGVYAEKTAWGQYWEDAGIFSNSTGYLKSLKNTKFGDNPIEPWSGLAFKNLSSYEENVLSKNYKSIGQSDKLMGKISKGLGVLSSVGSVIGSTIQFANTLYGLKKQQEQIRLQTSSNLTSTSSAFLNKKFFFDLYDKENYVEWKGGQSEQSNRVNIYDKLLRETYFGYKTIDKYGLIDYYGFEMFYEETGLKIIEVKDGWIVMSDGEMLYRKLYNKFKHILRNDIIEAIVKMLTQGVRVLPKP